MGAPAPLAANGGTPVRKTLLPYARQSISDNDIAAVTRVMRSDYLTTGPEVPAFEQEFAAFTGAKHAVAVNNGTAALHAACHALGVGPGDEVIVPAMTFAATANAVAMLGGTPIFADITGDTLLIDPADVERKITPKTKAVFTVDYTGQPCDYDALAALCENKGIALASDACHALGGSYKGRPVGSLAAVSTFSFHAVKPLATGEGGMITTDSAECATTMRRFRNHGITTEVAEREKRGTWFYAMEDLGWNYRLTDMQCALGRSQLTRVTEWTARRTAIAKRYHEAFATLPGLVLQHVQPEREHAWHLYALRFEQEHFTARRDDIFRALRAENIGVNLHYIPVHLHPFYQRQFGTTPGMCPVAEHAYEGLMTLPLFAAMTDDDATDVITAIKKVHAHYAR